MAITGSGTKEDPWVPDTWDDLVKILTDSVSTYGIKNYISIPEGTVWDMNEIHPEGVNQLNTPSSARGYIIQGNGLVIKNLYCRGNWLFRYCIYVPVGDKHDFRMYDIHFENLHLNGGFYTSWKTGNYNQGSVRAYFYGCTFSGISDSPGGSSPNQIFDAFKYSRSFMGQITFDVSPYTNNGCGFNMEGHNIALFGTDGGADYDGGETDFNINYSHIVYKGSTLFRAAQANNANRKYAYFLGCYIEGEFNMRPTNDAYMTGLTSIFDVKSDDLSSDTGGNPLLLYNKDKCSPTYATPGFIGLTTEELQDASFLRSIGFPIAVNGS